MGPESYRLNAEERSRLVAYLDGELPEIEARALAARVEQDPILRREVDSLRETWDLLDSLPRPQVSPEFGSSTLTLATQSVRLDDRLSQLTTRIARPALQTLVGLLVALAAFAVGLVGTRWLWPDPTARLARDLSLAEHFQEYRAVGSFEFLNQLDASAEFDRSD